MNTRLLRNYVRSILREMSYEDVKESNDPLDWIAAAFHDPEEWGADDPYAGMLNAAGAAGLSMIGRPGSSRVAFELDGNKVVKLARNNKGIEQNKLEAFAGKDPFVHKILAAVHDYSDEFAWIVADKVRPLDDGDGAIAEKIIGIPWSRVRDLIGVGTSSDEEATEVETPKAGAPKSQKAGGGGRGCLTGDAFLSYVDDFTTRYQDMLPGDLAKLSSWGVTPKGCLVLLDYGITRKKFRELYR